MKVVSHANRGKGFESYITHANNAYRNDGVAVIEKQYVEMLPIRDRTGRVVSCKVGEKSSVDYIGRLWSTPIAIEAKETQAGAIRFDAVKRHQAAFLEDFMAGGRGISLVVVSFDTRRFFAVPAVFWLVARKAWQDAQRKGRRKADKITVTCHGQTWTTPGKASATPEDLLPEWEITLNGRYGLHYLKDAKKYIHTQQHEEETP